MAASTSLTPEQRVLRSRMAAHARWAREDPKEGTAKARANSPSSMTYWLRKVDPDGTLAEGERRRRAESARSEHFARMAYRSSVARKAAR